MQRVSQAEHHTILVINAGSSSIKFSVFETGEILELRHSGLIENVIESPEFSVRDKNNRVITNTRLEEKGHQATLTILLDWLDGQRDTRPISAIGHRVVHGGETFVAPVTITPNILEGLNALVPLAPLHQPHNVAAIETVAARSPNLPQVACFDTAFHATQPRLSRTFALPRKLTQEGMIRYGFHGLSYEYITSVLPSYVEEKAQGRVIIAHLGNGASMCAVNDGKSVATTMGFTALDGLMMGTRTGAIDPGILLHLLEQKGMSPQELNTILYKQSGLLGVSGISHDMRKLEQSSAAEAKEAIELFCYRAAREIGSLTAALGGLDVLVFTAGIGEKSALVRQKITGYSTWLGMTIDTDQNNQHSTIIHTANSRIKVLVTPTNEERMIAQHTLGCLHNHT